VCLDSISDLDITSVEDELETDQSVRGGKQDPKPKKKPKKMEDLNRQDSVDGVSGARAASAAALLSRSRVPRPESPPSDEVGSEPDQLTTWRQRYWRPPRSYTQYRLQHHTLQIPQGRPTSPPFAPSPLQKKETQGLQQRDTNIAGSPSFGASIEDGLETDRSLKGSNQNRNPEPSKMEDLNRQNNFDGSSSSACAASSALPSPGRAPQLESSLAVRENPSSPLSPPVVFLAQSGDTLSTEGVDRAPSSPSKAPKRWKNLFKTT
jgi:hypothetical protein